MAVLVSMRMLRVYVLLLFAKIALYRSYGTYLRGGVTMASIIVNDLPMQFLGPAENGV